MFWDTGPIRTEGDGDRRHERAAGGEHAEPERRRPAREPARHPRRTRAEVRVSEGRGARRRRLRRPGPCHAVPLDAASAHPRLRGGDGLARRGDRGRAAARPLLRRLHDRLGEHDRDRARRALGRLLARRAARGPASQHARPLPDGAARGAPARGRSRSRRTRCSTWRSTRSTRSPPAPSSARCVAVLVLVAVPVLLLGTVSPWAIRLARAVGRGGGHGGRPPVRAVHRGLAGRHAPVRAAPDPAGRHAAHLPDLRARDRRGRRARACGPCGAGRSRRP